MPSFSPGVKEVTLMWIPHLYPGIQCLQCVITEINNPAHSGLLRLIDLDPPFFEVHILNNRIEQLSDPHPCPEQYHYHGPIPDTFKHSNKPSYIIRIHGARKGVWYLDEHLSAQQVQRQHTPFNHKP